MKLKNIFKKEKPANQVKMEAVKPAIKKQVFYEILFVQGRDHELDLLTDKINTLLIKGWKVKTSSIYRNKILLTLTHII